MLFGDRRMCTLIFLYFTWVSVKYASSNTEMVWEREWL